MSQVRVRYLFRRVTIIKIINDTFPSILIQSSSSHRRQNFQANLKNILNLPHRLRKCFYPFNELSLSQMRKGSFQIEKKVAC